MSYLKKIIKNSLKTRLIIAFFTALILLISGIYAYLFVLNPNILIDHILNKQVSFLIEDIKTDPQGVPYVFQSNSEEGNWIYSVLNKDIFYQIINKKGEVVSSSSKSFKAFSPNNEPYNKDTTYFNFNHENSLFYALNHKLPLPFANYNLQVATSLRLLDVFQITNISPISKTVLLVSLLSLLIVSIAVIITIHFMLRPLRDASAVAYKITPQNLQGRLSIAKIPDELVPLISAFNEALARLEQGFKVQQEFLAT
ncbi:hypothetical protein AB8E32_07640 [Marinomonas polaris]|uniref:hypothetical protein n=1 Tax=Marinomonas polaris TaxID=293552 RepID=UPI003517033C